LGTYGHPKLIEPKKKQQKAATTAQTNNNHTKTLKTLRKLIKPIVHHHFGQEYR